MEQTMTASDYNSIMQLLVFVLGVLSWYAIRLYTRKEKASKEGFVYVIQNPLDNSIKIGMTKKDVETRVRSLSKSKGTQLKVLKVYTCRNAREVEKKLHHKFADFRLPPTNDNNGGTEWFDGKIARLI